MALGGVFALLGLGGAEEPSLHEQHGPKAAPPRAAPPRAALGSAGPPPPAAAMQSGDSRSSFKAKRPDELQTIATTTANTTKEIRRCDSCGEMRKTTQGLCAACFLAGGSGGAGLAMQAEKDSKKKRGGRLPSLTDSPAELRPRRARSPPDFRSNNRTAAGINKSASVVELGTSSSSGARPSSSSGSRAAIGQLLTQQKESFKSGFSAAQPKLDTRRDGEAPQMARSQTAASNWPAARDVVKAAQDNPNLRPTSYRPGPGEKQPKAVAERKSIVGPVAPEQAAPSTAVAQRRAVEETRLDKKASEAVEETRLEKKPDSSGYRDKGIEAVASAGKDQKEREIKAEEKPRGRRGDKAALPPPDLPGGFRRGDVVQSLISRIRHGRQVLELGHEGILIGVSSLMASQEASAPPKSKGADKNGESDPNSRLLVQFKVGFDWLIAPHQVCLQNQFQSVTAAGLPGGFKWGDRVQNLLLMLQPKGAKRSLTLGEEGTVVGPGAISGKLAIRFRDTPEAPGGEWSLWPNAVCKAEAYATAVNQKMPGGFKRGDRVRSKALKGVGCADAENVIELKDSPEGTVVGPGHQAGRLLVCFDGNPNGWSVEPSVLVPA